MNKNMVTKDNYLKNEDGSTYKDHLGKEIHVDDKIVFHRAYRNNTTVSVGEVVFPTKKFLEEACTFSSPRRGFVYFKSDESWNCCRAPHNVVVIG